MRKQLEPKPHPRASLRLTRLPQGAANLAVEGVVPLR